MRTHPERHLNNQQLRFLSPPQFSSRWMHGFLCCVIVLLATGCASYATVKNQRETEDSGAVPYRLRTWAERRTEEDFVFILAFSGGGTRAAAMAYGVLEELRDTPIDMGGQQERLLDKVTHISSVSGGSFTAAYYGLYGDGIFENFETEFLRKDVEGHLTRSLFRPVHWFSRKGRTERAIDYYNKILFHDATFQDMLQPHRPMIVINASDLSWGVRFSFIQDYFNLLCSDLLSFPVARAVAASSAVPVVFNPVAVENYSGCDEVKWPPHVNELASESQEFAQTLEGLKSYEDKSRRKYIHFVDGGITDNTGLRAMTDVINIAGGPRAMLSTMNTLPPRRVILLSVNASTEHHSDMDESLKEPSMLASLNSMTDVQLHRYNAATIDESREGLEAWATQVSTPEKPVTPYFIQVSFEEIPEPSLKLFLNKIPTSFSLDDEQVDSLISNARKLLRADPEFQRLLADISAQ